jgi:DNA repair exonuclease SbcCD nuclease subunit
LPEVALLHTQVHTSLGSEAHHAYAPSELTYLMRAGYDYWALGHVHVRQTLSEDPPVVYPGNLQGRTHADTGPKGCILADLSDRDAPALSFRAIAPVRWETIRVDGLEEADTLDRLERRVALAWKAAREEKPAATEMEWMIRVVLAGPCPLWRELRREEDREALSGELVELLGALDVSVVHDAVHPVLDLDEHRSRPDVLGETLRLMEEVRLGKATLEGLDPGTLAGVNSEERGAVDAYIRSLLQGVEGEVVARMLGEGGGG